MKVVYYKLSILPNTNILGMRAYCSLDINKSNCSPYKKKKRYLLIHDVSLTSNVLCFLEYEDGDLSSWINRERFQGYLNVDGFTLYELGDTGEMLLRLKSVISETELKH